MNAETKKGAGGKRYEKAGKDARFQHKLRLVRFSHPPPMPLIMLLIVVVAVVQLVWFVTDIRSRLNHYMDTFSIA